MATATVPFEITETGVVYIEGTRVTLDTVIHTFREGATAEEIVMRYPTLDLADVYSTIGYYLHNTREVEEYLERSAEESKRVRALNESKFPPDGILERLLARKKQIP
jgi:uncharacterized protein (DUF433 family)